jgi:NOL1/NOP2/fmu family ribosome biogenesis protein/precorrin-6B methylase 2
MSAAALLDPQPGERILDLAAAPGGKTTHLASRMQAGGLLVANEIKDKRLGHLAMNVERWGAGNVAITNESPERLADHFGAYFDRVLVDAPCSGEGMFRKDMGARADWSPEMVAGCAVRQRNILRVAAKLVRPGGHLLYSTCTFAPEENEAVAAEFLRTFPDFETAELPLFAGFERGKPEWLEGAANAGGLEKAARLFPHRVRGEGHFGCLLRRGGEGKPRPGREIKLPAMNRLQAGLWQEFAQGALTLGLTADRLRVRGERLYLLPQEMPDFGNLRLVHPGVWLGTFKTGRFEPAHPLALFLRPGQALRTLNLPVESPALTAYLRGEPLPSPGEPGWTLVTADGWPLGWGKQSQGVLKNHFPRGWMQA